jgi:hypothetical protein
MRTTGGIPRKVLNGQDKKFISVHNTYKAYFLKRFFELLNRSFWARAKGGTDDLGNKWKPLHPKTHAYKPLSPMEKKTYSIGGRRFRGLLTPEQNKKWQAIYASKLKQFQKKGVSDPEKKAASAAWNLIKGLAGARTKLSLNRLTDINIRTGRLVKATYPGQISNNRYYAGKDQQVIVSGTNVKVKITVPYANEVDRVRPIIPTNCKAWVEDAHKYALEFAKRQYDVLRQNSNSSSNSSKKRARRTQRQRNSNKPRR